MFTYMTGRMNILSSCFGGASLKCSELITAFRMVKMLQFNSALCVYWSFYYYTSIKYVYTTMRQMVNAFLKLTRNLNQFINPIRIKSPHRIYPIFGAFLYKKKF